MTVISGMALPKTLVPKQFLLSARAAVDERMPPNNVLPLVRLVSNFDFRCNVVLMQPRDSMLAFLRNGVHLLS